MPISLSPLVIVPVPPPWNVPALPMSISQLLAGALPRQGFLSQEHGLGARPTLHGGHRAVRLCQPGRWPGARSGVCIELSGESPTRCFIQHGLCSGCAEAGRALDASVSVHTWARAHMHAHVCAHTCTHTFFKLQKQKGAISFTPREDSFRLSSDSPPVLFWQSFCNIGTWLRAHSVSSALRITLRRIEHKTTELKMSNKLLTNRI